MTPRTSIALTATTNEEDAHMNVHAVLEPSITYISLPFPVSANRMYRAVKGRSILSAEYRLWKDEAGWQLQTQHPPQFTRPVSIFIHLRAPDKRKRDADNSLKPVLDLLRSHKVIEDDNNQIVKSITVEWTETGAPCVVTVQALS